MLRIEVRLPGGKETSFDLEGGDIFIGRVPAINDLCLNDPSVSRQHAHIKRREEGYTIYDLRSLNGVILNGTRVSRAILKSGDELRLGAMELKIHLEPPSQEETIRGIESAEATLPEAMIRTLEVTSPGRKPPVPRKKPKPSRRKK